MPVLADVAVDPLPYGTGRLAFLIVLGPTVVAAFVLVIKIIAAMHRKKEELRIKKAEQKYSEQEK